ncbi:hypothetical protein, partial [Brevibacillus sp. SIMBA_040]
NDAGLTGELEAKQRAKVDERRAELARERKALRKPERELAAATEEATRARIALDAAQTAFRDADRADKQATARVVMMERQHE